MYFIDEKAAGSTGCKQKERMEQTSHKIIEKRRRDRINNCLTELSQTVPAAFAKQNVGKLEKAEILEMTVEYLRAIQTTELGIRFQNGDWYSSDVWGDFIQHYQSGYSDCMKEILSFLMDVEGVDVNDARCARMMSYLQTRFRPESSVAGGVAYREISTRLAARMQAVPAQHPPSNMQINGFPHRPKASVTDHCLLGPLDGTVSAKIPSSGDSRPMLTLPSVIPDMKLRMTAMPRPHLPNMYEYRPMDISKSGTTSEPKNFGSPRWLPPSLPDTDREKAKLGYVSQFGNIVEKHTGRNS